MNAFQNVAAGHEDLWGEQRSVNTYPAALFCRRTLSNAVEQALGWVATKIGFFDMILLNLGTENSLCHQGRFLAKFEETGPVPTVSQVVKSREVSAQ
jgi:hypothetical protein